MTYTYPRMEWIVSATGAEKEHLYLAADGHRTHPHGGGASITADIGTGWCELKTHNGNKGSVRYSAHRTMHEAMDAGEGWAKRKYREHLKLWDPA